MRYTLTVLCFVLHAAAFSLEGTWTSKSQTVFTGPGFFDPVDELLIEPALPGISYSFDAHGHWEQAIYQVNANPINHSCPTAVLLWQHGTYKVHEEKGATKLVLQPIPVDGRQLLSDPCNDHGKSTYMRYNQVETISNYVIELDHYYGQWRLQLFDWDGSKKQPLYLHYKPPMMLPTRELNPVAKKNWKVTHLNSKFKRALANDQRTSAVRREHGDTVYDVLFSCFCLTLVVVSTVLLLRLPKKLGPKTSV